MPVNYVPVKKEEPNWFYEAVGWKEHYRPYATNNKIIYGPLLLNFIYSGTLAVFFGIYYLANPDAHYRKDEIEAYPIPVDMFCWSTMQEEWTEEDPNWTRLEQSNYDIVASVLPPFFIDRYTINVTSSVLAWLEYGFIILSVAFGGSCICLFMGPESEFSLRWGVRLCLFLNCVAALPWILTGTIIRFRLAGQRCSGIGNYDKQLTEGDNP